MSYCIYKSQSHNYDINILLSIYFFSSKLHYMDTIFISVIGLKIVLRLFHEMLMLCLHNAQIIFQKITMNIIDPEAMYDMFMLLTHKVTLCDDKVPDT